MGINKKIGYVETLPLVVLQFLMFTVTFLINNGNASASDFEILGNMIIEKVNSEFGILLDWEIHIVGEHE